MEYKIMTLSLKNMIDLICNSEKSSTPMVSIYEFDLGNRAIYDAIVDKVESYPDSAFFYQTALASGFDLNNPSKEDSLYDKVLFLDCNGVFYGKTIETKKIKTELKPDKIEQRKQTFLRVAKQIFTEGIKLQYTENGVSTHYLPFDKSSSMARESRITFVDSSIRKALDDRICLNIDFSKFAENVIASKFYAYRGLMLTSARRVEFEQFLGEEAKKADQLLSKEEQKKERLEKAKKLASSIIVVDIGKKPFGSINVISAEKVNTNSTTSDKDATEDIIDKDTKQDEITAEAEEKEKGKEASILWKRIEATLDNEHIDPYDGEGLISTEWSKCLDNSLKCRNNVNNVLKNYLVSNDPLFNEKALRELHDFFKDINKKNGIDEGLLVTKINEKSEKLSLTVQELFEYKKKDSKISEFLGIRWIAKDKRKFYSLIKRIIRCKYEIIADSIIIELDKVSKESKLTEVEFKNLLDKHIGIEQSEIECNKLFARLFANQITSYQIRLPFGKGMLHEVDFHRFFTEEVGFSDDAEIEDVYGRKRKISDVQIILTNSMFKISGWLKKYWELEEYWEKSPEKKSHYDNDPMVFYFYKSLYYDHALYIANTNAVLHNDGTVPLNYQFLAAMDLENKEIEDIARNQLNNVTETAKNKLFAIDDIPENESTDSADLTTKKAPWAIAYSECKKERKNNNLLRDAKIQGLLRATEESISRDVAIGRIFVKGECRFLSRDLLSLLLDIAKMVEESESGKESKMKTIQTLKHNTIKTNHYYIPQMKVNVPRESVSVILRNPHLSRNEETLAKLFWSPEKLYDTYFSHLDGVVMVSYDSLIPMAVGGADFDGDLVKVIHDKTIVEAVERGVYDKDSEELQRKLSVISIPGVSGNARNLNACVAAYGEDNCKKYGLPTDFEVIQSTFNSRVGLISNRAVRFAKRDKEKYDLAKCAPGKIDPEKAKEVSVGNTDSAECTILTGLEIDAAKNGRRPSFSSINKRLEALNEEDKNKTGGNDYFISFKEMFERLPKFMRGWKAVPSGEDWKIIYQFKNRFLVKKTMEPEYTSAIDLLPWIYFEHKAKGNKTDETSTGSQKRKTGTRIYTFASVKNVSDGVENKVIQIIKAYNAVIKKASDDYKNSIKVKNAKYGDKIKGILRLQYDSLFAGFSSSSRNVIDVFQDAYGKVFNYYFNQNLTIEEKIAAVKASIASIQSDHWAIMDASSKKEYIEEYQFDDDELTLLTNFSCGGFKILYYMLKSVLVNLLDPSSSDEQTEQEDDTNKEIDTEETSGDDSENEQKGSENVDENDSNKNLTPKSDTITDATKYLKIYNDAKNSKVVRKTWHDSLVKQCQEDIEAVFSNNDMHSDDNINRDVDWDFVARIAYSQRKAKKADPNGDFFWSVIPPDVIAKNVVEEKDVAETKD